MTAAASAELADTLGVAVLAVVLCISVSAVVGMAHERWPRLLRAAVRLLLAPLLVPLLLARASRQRYGQGSDWSLLTGTPLDIDVPASLATRRLR